MLKIDIAQARLYNLHRDLDITRFAMERNQTLVIYKIKLGFSE